MKATLTKKLTSIFMLSVLLVSSFAFAFSANIASATDDIATVTVVKYIDGQMATAANASSTDFQMHASWTTNGSSDQSDFALSENGFNGDPTPYQAVSNFASSTDLSLNEVIDGTIVGSTCDAGASYSLIGYTSGDTMAEAAAATPTGSLSLSGMTSDKFIIVWNHYCGAVTPPPGDDEIANVTVIKYMDGVAATGANSNNADFQINADYNINLTSGSEQLTLSETNTTAYQAVSLDLPFGSYYNTSEVIDGTIVGNSCDAGAQYSLVGYTSGNTLAEAQAGTPSLTVPSFGFINSDKYVIVWNHDCDGVVPPPDTATVTIVKYIDGQMATAANASSTNFHFNSNYVIGGNNSSEVLSLNGTTTVAYQTSTSPLPVGSGYSLTEVLDGAITGESCTTGAKYSLAGYTYGNTLAEAALGTPSTVMPSTSSLESDKFVIIWNNFCADNDDTSGTIGGDVSGGTATGTLAVTSIDVLDNTAVADGTFTNGWKYRFNITVPTDEADLSMKFSDWTGAGTIAAANNMRISSAQADNGGATVTITAANTFSSPALHMTGDLDPTTAGRQVQVLLEVSIPSSTVNGSYTTNYTVRTE